MSTVNIRLLKTVDISKPNASKSYKQMVVTHTDGKDTTGKKIFDFSTPKHVWDTLAAAKDGDCFTITREKDAKEGKYWEWKDIAAATGEVAAPTPSPTTVTASTPAATPARVGSWETPEERGKKQVYIVRQSSINAAIETLKSTGKPFGTDAVKNLAGQYEAYVFSDGVAGMVDDTFPE